MKTVTLILLAIATLVSASCSVRGHANRHSTGAGISTDSGRGVSGAIRY